MGYWSFAVILHPTTKKIILIQILLQTKYKKENNNMNNNNTSLKMDIITIQTTIKATTIMIKNKENIR